ncbi:MAG: AsmA-like C-terminal region-containing protein [Gemmatimonadota bacterium]
MSRKKKLLIAVGATFGGLLVALLVLPFLFVDRVEARVRDGIERATRVRVSWSDANLGLLRSFPHPTLSLSGLTVVGTGSFDGDTLAAVRELRLSLDGPSAIRAARGRGPLVIRSVGLDEPKVRLRVHEDGAASWDVLAEREGAGDVGAGDPGGGRAAGPGVAVSLRSFEVTDGDLVVDDASSGLMVALGGLRHSLRGDFSRESLVASTRARADAMTVRFAGVPYLSGVSLEFEGDFDVDMAEGSARLADNELRLNDLLLRLDGSLARAEAGIAMDLDLEAPSTGFGQLLSLVPVVYGRDFASLETSGTFSLDGSVRGTYGADAFPSLALRVNVADGSFRYPDLPLPAEAISANVAITNPGGDLDSTVIDLSAFHIEIGGQPLDGGLTLRTLMSDPEADLRVEGTLDLADLARTVKLENGEGLGGVVVADASMHARRSDVDGERYDRIAAQGTVSAHDVTLRGEGLRQPIDVREARIRLTPRTAELSAFDARLGSSDLQATGRLDNLLWFALGREVLSGSGDFTSTRFVLDEWKSDEGAAAIPVPAMLDLTLDGTIGELVVNGLEMTNARGRAIVRDQRLTLEGFALETLGGRVALDGYYETLDSAEPTFALELGLDSLDVAGASEAFLTVRRLAPIARYARGTFSSTLNLSGALGQDLTPRLEVLEGDGEVTTSRIAIEDFPLLARLGERLQLQRLSNPTVDAIRSTIRIQGGRLVVDPFQVGIPGLAMTVSGSNGIDQSLDYSLALEVPRAGFAEDALTDLASRAGPLAAGLAAADPVPVAARVTGTVTRPSIDLRLSETVGSVRDAATDSAAAAVDRRVDAETEEARRRARARADSIVAEAERRADQIRTEAAAAAEKVRAEGDRAAEELLARAGNPLARAAAQPAADRIRQEADRRAAAIERAADARATTLVEEARARAAEPTAGGEGVR